jgi:putative ABC transport system permease protein
MIGRIRKRLRTIVYRARYERELDLELQFHVDMLTAQHLRSGLSPALARRAAMRAFGPVAGVKDDVRDTWLARIVESALQDVRHGGRTLATAPAFALGMILTIALAIGVNTSIFGIAYGLLLRPLPFDAPADLVVLQHGTSAATRITFSPPELNDYRGTSGFDALAEVHSMWFILLGTREGGRPAAEPQRVSTGVVSPDYFSLLGVRPAYGRTLSSDDDQPGAPAVLLLTDEYWRRAFGADPSVVGRVFEMNDRPHTVVGVLPPFPQYPQTVDVYMPTAACPFRSRPSVAADRRARMGRAIGRLHHGVTFEQAQDNLAQVATRLARDYRQHYAVSGLPYVAAALPLDGEMRRELRPTLLLLLATAGLVLLIACVSVSNLTLARLTQRAHELSLRSALGATRPRIVRQLVTENFFAVATGTVAGLLLARISLGLLTGYVQSATNVPVDTGLSVAALGCAGAVSLLLLVASAGVPLLRSRASLDATMPRRATPRMRCGLVVGQVALSFVLSVAAVLSVRSLLHLQGIDTGFTATNVQTMRLDLNFTKYHEASAITAFWRQFEARLSAIPGVVSAGGAGTVPLDGQRLASTRYTLDVTAAGPADAFAPRANLRVASPGYFTALGQPVVEGRAFTREDGLVGRAVVVVNETLARNRWPGGAAVGRQLRVDGMMPTTVVGVVEDARQRLEEPAGEEIYFPMLQTGQLSTQWLVRSSLRPDEVEARVRAVVRALDPDQPVDSFRSLESFRDASLLPSRVTATVVGLFSVLALVITTAGIAGVVGFTAERRRHEFGVRLALGAPRRCVLAMVLHQGLMLVAAGLLFGTLASLPILPFVRASLTGIDRLDPAEFALVTVALLLVAVAACIAPAVRAARLDVWRVLRAE